LAQATQIASSLAHTPEIGALGAGLNSSCLLPMLAPMALSIKSPEVETLVAALAAMTGES
jgi:hypothetical protein